MDPGRGLNEREDSVIKKILLNQVRQRTEILSTFLPNEVLNMPWRDLNDGSTHKFMGVLLMVEIVGFTTICEKYRKTGRGGIYRLTASLNAYLGALIEIIQFFDGDILKFSGEGMLALWKSPPSLCLYEVIHEVIVCSLFIQRNVGRFETEVNVLLKLKLAISCGNLTFTVLGKDQIKTFILIGQAIYDLRKALTLCCQGEVSVGPSAWGHVSEKNYEVTFAEEGVVKVWKCLYFAYQQKLNITYHEKFIVALELCNKHLHHQRHVRINEDVKTEGGAGKVSQNFTSSLKNRQAVQEAHRKWIPNDLKPFVVKLVQAYVDTNQPIEYLTEMKEATILSVFVVPGSVKETELMSTMAAAFSKVDGIVSKVKGMFYKVNLFHKNITIYTVFGLSGVRHEMESQNALKAASAIKKSVAALDVERISIGVSNGLVYCGVIGHPFRKEFSILGTTVHKAEKMMYTFDDKITCDYETYKNSKLTSIHFQLQTSNKNIEDFVFEYNEDFETICKVEAEPDIFRLIGRESELEQIEKFLKTREPTMYGLCCKGQAKQGRTKLLERALDTAKSITKFTASVTLHSDLTRSFFCVSLLYQHLYDVLATEDPLALSRLPRILWDFGEVLQTNRIDPEHTSFAVVPENVSENFLTLVSRVPQKSTIFFIDNIEYIDQKSFDLLNRGLKNRMFRIICTGHFATSTKLLDMSQLSKQFKIVTIKPLQTRHILPIICNIMNIQGVSRKVLHLFQTVGHCQPGWIATSLLKLTNNGELEMEFVTPNHEAYIFLEHYNQPLPLVAKFSKKYFQYKDKQLTLPPITIDVFESFTTLERNILKIAAVIGKVISRSILMGLVNITDELEFARIMYKFFRQQVFDCASKFIYSGGLKDETASCLCYMTDDELQDTKKLTKFAYCKLVYFKSRIIRTIAYELMPHYQKKEMHLTLANVLEMQNNSCPSCLRDNSTALMNMMPYAEFRKYCTSTPKNYTWVNSRNKEDQLSTEDYKQIIRSAMKSSSGDGGTKMKLKRSTNKNHQRRGAMWDPTICFCLEILTKVYKDLIHHSEKGGHELKTIYFKMQYGLILFLMGDANECIKVLSAASELCQSNVEEDDPDTSRAKKILFGRIHYNLGNTYYKLGNLAAAKNHASISMRQYDVPLLSFSYSFFHKLLNEVCLSRFTRSYNSDNPLIKYDFGMCLNLIGNIFGKEGKWNFAKSAVSRSLACLRRANPNIDALCDIYSNAIDLYNFCGDSHTCEKLERCFNKDLLRYYSNNDVVELYSVSMLMGVIFRIKVMSGQIKASVRLGFRALYFDTNIQAYYLLLEVLPILASILLLLQRIDEAVHVAHILFNIGKKYNFDGYLAYYGFCIELILETNFYLETIDKIVDFANGHLNQHAEKQHWSDLDKKLIIGLCVYETRRGRISNNSNEWKRFYNWNEDTNCRFVAATNLMKATEMVLLEFFYNSKLGTKRYVLENRRCNVYLYKCKIVADKWEVFKPRYLHLLAYFQKMKLKNAKALLTKAKKLANKQENILESNWSNLSASHWFGGISLSGQVEPVTWKTARTFTSEQWSQILFALPYA